MDDELFEVFATKMGEYIMQNFVIPYMKEHGMMQSYRAQVVSVDSNAGTMVVQRPFDNQITLPYTAGASSLSAGDYCTVFVLGDSSNARVISDGNISTL